MIRLAEKEDLSQIMAIVKASIAVFRTYGNPQWGKYYPLEKDFLKDIAQGHLYISSDNCRVNGFACFNHEVPSQYAPFALEGHRPLVLHRMAVEPELRRQGIAHSLIGFGRNLAERQGCDSLLTDTCCVNQAMIALLEICGFRAAGSFFCYDLPKGFVCYELAF